MIGDILAIALRLAVKLPRLIGLAEGAYSKINADQSLGVKLLDGLRALESALDDLLPSA
jgi:hypothetical protein